METCRRGTPQPAQDVLSVLLRGTRVRRGAQKGTGPGACFSLPSFSASPPASSLTTSHAADGTAGDSSGAAVRSSVAAVWPTFTLPGKRQRPIHSGKENSGYAGAGNPGDELDFFGYSRKQGRHADSSSGDAASPGETQPTQASNSSTRRNRRSGVAAGGSTGIRAYEEAAALRKKYRIHIKAADTSTLPKPFESFSECVTVPTCVKQDFSVPSPAAEEFNSCTGDDNTEEGRKCTNRKRKDRSISADPNASSAVASSTGKSTATLKSEASASDAPLSAASSTVESITAEKRKCPHSTVQRLPEWVVANLHEANITTPTPIQMQAIPVLLQGENLLASAPTGSGKTLAFLLPLLARLKKPGKAFSRMLVICPSRELARQTQRTFDRFAGRNGFRCCLLDELELDGNRNNNGRQGLDAAISTPLKVVHFIRNKKISLADCRHLVLDEADKLLDYGFAPQLDEILSSLSNPRLQVCLFSATLPPEVLGLADSFLHAPIHISVGAPNAAALSIDQELMFCTNEEGKLMALRTLHLTGRFIPPVLVFVQSKERAQQLYCELLYDGLFVECIHADKTKQQRDDIVDAFRRGQIWVLVCTDVMARGVDFKNVEVVINYDFPQSASAYIHRIGRTGRAGRGGRAITFYTFEDLPYLRNVVGVMQQTSTCNVPAWMRQITKLKKIREKVNLQKNAIKRKPILTTPAVQAAKKIHRRKVVKVTTKMQRKHGDGETAAADAQKKT